MISNRLRYIPALLVSIAIAVLSLHEEPLPIRPVSLSDKTLHGLAYSLQAITLLWALWRSYQPGMKSMVLTMVYTVTLGGLMELLQMTLTSTRYGEWLDLTADAIGAALGIAIMYILLTLIDRHKECNLN